MMTTMKNPNTTIITLLIVILMICFSLPFILTPQYRIKYLKNRVESLEKEISDLQNELLKRENEISNLSHKIDNLINERNELERKLSIKESEISKLSSKIDELIAERDALKGKLSEYETTISDLNDEIDELTDELSKLSGQIDELNAEKDSLMKKLLELRSKMNLTLIDISFSRTEDTSSLLQYWINRANDTIYVMVMCITQDELAEALINAHKRGVDVKVIIDDQWLYSSGSDYEKLLAAGVDVRGDDREGLMHHKVMIIDGCIVVTGSYNWSWSAENENDENIIILRSQRIAQEYLEEFNRIWRGTTSPPGVMNATLHVVINEVELNPPGTDTGNEWIELYNPTNYSIDLGGWRISTTHGVTVTIVLEEGTIIEPHGYLVISYWGQWLDNEGESIILRNRLGVIIDVTPALYDTFNDLRSWSRYPNGRDTDSKSDWLFRVSTRGRSNG